MRRNRTPERGRRGFSLIETALALAVVGVGILGVAGLFPIGIEMSRRAAEDSQAVLFAASVLDGIRAQARAQPPASVDELRSRSFRIMVPGWEVATSDGDAITTIEATTSPRLLIFRHPTDPDAEDVHLWYRLDILPETRVEWGPFTFQQTQPTADGPFTENVFIEAPVPHMAKVRLMVWMGHNVYRGGSTTSRNFSPANPNLFYPKPPGAHQRKYYVYYNSSVHYFYADLYLAQ